MARSPTYLRAELCLDALLAAVAARGGRRHLALGRWKPGLGEDGGRPFMERIHGTRYYR
jgi:hypothetical protein